MRDSRGRRRYDRLTVDRLLYIAEARRAGLQITEIRKLLAIGDRDGEAQRAAWTQELYRQRLVALDAQREALEQSAGAMGFCLAPQRPQLVAS